MSIVGYAPINKSEFLLGEVDFRFGFVTHGTNGLFMATPSGIVPENEIPDTIRTSSALTNLNINVDRPAVYFGDPDFTTQDYMDLYQAALNNLRQGFGLKGDDYQKSIFIIASDLKVSDYEHNGSVDIPAHDLDSLNKQSKEDKALAQDKNPLIQKYEDLKKDEEADTQIYEQMRRNYAIGIT